MVVFCLWTPGMRGQPLEGAQDLLSLPPPQLTNPFHTPAPSILTSSSSEMLRSRMVSDLRAKSGRFLDTSPWTQNENTDEFLLNSAYGIYPGLWLIKRTRWILTLLRWYGGLNILKLGFHGGNTSLPYAGNFLFSLQGFSPHYSFLSYCSFGLQLALAILSAKPQNQDKSHHWQEKSYNRVTAL